MEMQPMTLKKRKDAELKLAAEVKLLSFSLEVTEMHQDALEGHYCTFDALSKKTESPDWDGFDRFRGGTASVWVEGR